MGEKPSSAFPQISTSLLLGRRLRLGPFRLPHRQGALIEAQEGRIGEWLWGLRCTLSKSFYTHSLEVGGGRYYPHSLLGGKVT